MQHEPPPQVVEGTAGRVIRKTRVRERVVGRAIKSLKLRVRVRVRVMAKIKKVLKAVRLQQRNQSQKPLQEKLCVLFSASPLGAPKDKSALYIISL